MEGLQSNLLCRDEEDYDVIEKLLFVSAWQCNVIVVIHIVMSSHAHLCVLSPGEREVEQLGKTIKQKCSMYISKKYKERNILKRTRVDIQYLDDDRYVRNVLTYIPRNILDVRCRIEEYPWSSHRAMFSPESKSSFRTMVKTLSRREKEEVFHSHADLSNVPWALDENGHLDYRTCCDWVYLESAFFHEQIFFMRSIGQVSSAEMKQKLIINHHERKTDIDFYASISDVAGRWFNRTLAQLSIEQKARLIPYSYRSFRTNVNQLARCFKLERDKVRRILNDVGVKTG